PLDERARMLLGPAHWALMRWLPANGFSSSRWEGLAVELPEDAFTEVQLLQTGRVLVAPPPTGVSPRLSAADAVAALRRDGIKAATTAKDPSDVRLGIFTSPQTGER